LRAVERAGGTKPQLRSDPRTEPAATDPQLVRRSRGRSDRRHLPSDPLLDLPAALGVAVVVFASTNVDDVFVLAAFFADPRLRVRAIVLGQFLGIGALVAASAAAACAWLAMPDGYPALLGVVPLALGLQKLWGLRRSGRSETEDGHDEPAS